jgi:hypothetical protein
MAMNKRALLAAIDELVRSRVLMLIGWTGDRARP